MFNFLGKRYNEKEIQEQIASDKYDLCNEQGTELLFAYITSKKGIAWARSKELELKFQITYQGESLVELWNVHDEKIIKNVLKKRELNVTLEEANEIWDFYSTCLGANWLGVAENGEGIYEIILELIRDDEPFMWYMYKPEKPKVLNRLKKLMTERADNE